MTSPTDGLRCRECGRLFGSEARYVCEWCFGPLEVVYDYDAISGRVDRARIGRGPLSIWRYADLLPADPGGAVDLGAGYTPLIRADRLAAELGLGELWLKDDTRNPTGSFKDRVTSVALTQPASSVSRWRPASRRGTSPTPSRRTRPAPAWSATSSCRLTSSARRSRRRPCSECGSSPSTAPTTRSTASAPRSSTNTRNGRSSTSTSAPTTPRAPRRSPSRWPSSSAGNSLTTSSSPIASGSLLTKIDKGFAELGLVGLVAGDQRVRISGAQAAGCAPVARALVEGKSVPTPVRPEHDREVARHRESGRRRKLPSSRCATSSGSIATATDAEIIEGIRLLARTEGIFAETAGGVTIACLGKLAARRDRAPRRARRRLHHGDGAEDGRGVRRRRRAVGRHRTNARRLRGARRRLEEPRVSVVVRIPAQLRPVAGGRREIVVEAATVREAIDALEARHPGLKERIVDDDGSAAPVRQHLPRRPGRPVPRRAGHPRPGWPDALGRPGDLRRLITRRRDRP